MASSSETPVIFIFLVYMVISRSHGHIVPRVSFPLDSSGRPVTIFSLPDVYNTTTLLLREDEETLYVGARDAILSLNISNNGVPHLNKKLDWSPPEKNVSECTRRGNREIDCQNFVRVLQVINSTHLFACGTFAFSPSCSYIDVKQFSLLTGREEGGRGRCPYNPYQKNTAITVDRELYTGTVADYRGTRSVISRHLSEGSRVDLKLDDSVGWLEEPTFISSTYIPSEQKVYFFFSEVGREYDFIDKFTVSRVAQVCTSDVGGQRTLQKRWTTFTKAQLLCKDRGELPYNVLQDIVTLPPPEGASEDDTLFYGIFSSQWSGNSARSAVCAFSLRSIKAVFRGNYKALNKETLKWSAHLQEKIANPGQCGLHNASDNVLRFVKENFLADESVLPASQRVSLVSSDRRYSNIAAQRTRGADGKEYTVLYLLTESGSLHKAVLLEGGAHLIEEIQVFRQPQLVKNLVLSVTQRALLVGSSEGVASVPISNCSYYWSCAECVLARDPFCAWNVRQGICAETSQISGEAVQDVNRGDVSKACDAVLNPRSRIMKTPTGTPLSVTLNELVQLRCQSSSKLARSYWEGPGVSLSPKVCIQHEDGTLSFLATPFTMGTYRCQAEENGFTQTLAVYEVAQKDTSSPQPSTTTTTAATTAATTTTTTTTTIGSNHIPETGKEPTSPTRIGTTGTRGAIVNPNQASVTATQAIPYKSRMSPIEDDGAKQQQLETKRNYLRELVAVSVLLALSLGMLLLVALFNLRKRCRSRTAPHAATEQERQSLRGKQANPNGQNHDGKAPVTPTGSNGHLPNIPI